MNIDENFKVTLWRHDHEKTFFGIIWDSLFTSVVKLKLCFIFQTFQNGRHFELATNYFTGSYTGCWIYYKDSHEHFRHFELLIEALVQILTEIYQLKNWPTLWPGDVINNVMNMYLYKCSHNLMMPMHGKFNDDIFARLFVIMKNDVISFIKEYRGSILMLPCDVIDDVIIMKNTFWGIIWDDLLYFWGQIDAVFNISKFSKWPPFWARDKLFYRNLYRKLNIPER